MMSARLLKSIILAVLALIPVFGLGLAGAQEGNQTELVSGNNTFAFDLYQAVRGGDDNLIASPYSISLALAMAYAGARGETEQQMAGTLHYMLPQDQLHPAFKVLNNSLMTLTASGDQALRLKIANALWGQQDYPFRTDYMDLINANYGAGLQLVDFKMDPEAARQTINDWASQETEERIQNLLPQGTIKVDTRLVITNAIYFKGAWASQFDEGATTDGPFTLLDGSQVTVPMMFQEDSFGYTAGDGFQAIKLPYEGYQAAMLILLPDAGTFEEFESGLTLEQFNAVLGNLNSVGVLLTMPRFKYTSDFSLGQILANMGMPDAFSTNADFSGMTDRNDLDISDVIHKAFVEVNEEGTEAAAATAVIIGTTAMNPASMIQFTIDRPFIYVIYDQASGSILFMGRVLDPTQE
jgi:serpin B